MLSLMTDLRFAIAYVNGRHSFKNHLVSALNDTSLLLARVLSAAALKEKVTVGKVTGAISVPTTAVCFAFS